MRCFVTGIVSIFFAGRKLIFLKGHYLLWIKAGNKLNEIQKDRKKFICTYFKDLRKSSITSSYGDNLVIVYRMKFDRIQIQLFNFVFTKYVDTYPIAMFWNTVSCTRTPT